MKKKNPKLKAVKGSPIAKAIQVRSRCGRRLLMPGKTPTCPHCGESLADSVNQWIENAKSMGGKPKSRLLRCLSVRSLQLLTPPLFVVRSVAPWEASDA
jgi:hypothetical protein